MNKRQRRLALIVDILLHAEVGSQEELLTLLKSRNCEVTQATLSRDLKTLKTSKVANDTGGYRYVIGTTGMPTEKVTMPAVSNVRKAAIVSVNMSGQIVVIKTRNGYAGGIAYDLDELESPLILGTIAGADTVFAVVSEQATRPELYELLRHIIPHNIMQEALPIFK